MRRRRNQSPPFSPGRTSTGQGALPCPVEDAMATKTPSTVAIYKVGALVNRPVRASDRRPKPG